MSANMTEKEQIYGLRGVEYDTRSVSPQRYFLKHKCQALELEAFISEELASCTRSKNDQMQLRSRVGREKEQVDQQKLRTAVSSNALDMLLELQPVLDSLITEIRAEYHKFISVLSQGQLQFSFLRDEITKSLTDPLSIILLQNRKEQLKKRIAILKENNKRLQDQRMSLAQKSVPNSRAGRQTEFHKSSMLISDHYDTKEQESEHDYDHALLKKVSMSTATDLGKLMKYSAELQVKIQKLKSSIKSQYANKTFLQELKIQLSKKENIQHHLELYNERLKERYENLRTATESLQGTVSKSQKPITMSRMVDLALQDHRKSDQFEVQYLEAADTTEDDDPAKKREAESLMEYMDNFNDMISSKQYKEAAKHAANSPKGALRSYETIKIFMQIDETRNSGQSTTLMFCEALMITAKSDEKMSPGLSCEVVRCALNHQKLDLVSHWLSKSCFTYSLPMANLLMEYCTCQKPCQCGSVDLAKDIFSHLNAHLQAALCLLSTGKIHQMIQYGEDHKFTADEYIYICKRFPSTKLFLLIMSAHCDEKMSNLVSLPMVVNILLTSSNTKVLTEIMQEIYTNGLTSKEGKTKTLTDLVLAETIHDNMTKSKWNEVVEICSGNLQRDVAIELLSTLAVRDAIDKAAYWCLMDYIS